jgi:hypothetical protein
MKELSMNLLKLLFIWAMAVFLVASCGGSAYANGVQCKITEFALAGNQFSKGAYSPLRAFFVRNISMHSHFMVKLERDTFECAGFLLSLSANPFQLCHPYHLAVIGKASLNSKGAH